MADQAMFAVSGKAFKQRWIEAVDAPKEPKDGRSGDEIAMDVAERCGITIAGASLD